MKINQLTKIIKSNKYQDLYLYGAGEYGQTMKRYLDSIGIKVTAFFVSGRNRFDPEICCNIPVLVFDEHYISDNSFILICIACTSDIICKFKEIENYCCMDESMYLEICAMGALEKNDSVVIENKRELLQKKYNFPKWHLIPYSSKPYVQDIIDYIVDNWRNNCRDSSRVPYVLEVGCGLCDIIGDERFRTFKRIGIDCCKEVIYAAKEEYCSENLELFVGGFDDIRKQSIDYLITVNFLHEINDEDLHQIYNRLFTENKISMYIVDEVTGNYQHIHNYSKLIPQQYSIIHSLGPYKSDGGERYIKIFKLNE